MSEQGKGARFGRISALAGAAVAAVLLAAGSPAPAAEPAVLGAKATTEELIDALGGGREGAAQPGEPRTRGLQPRTRGFRALTRPSAPEAAAAGPADDACFRAGQMQTRGFALAENKDPEACRPGVALEINFEFNSAELMPESRELLDKLAAAMKSETLASARFLIAGHTDALGTDAYNQGLSERRAAAVQQYLSARHGVDSARLWAEGRGKRELLVKADPANPKNRRVEIVNLSR